MSTGCKRALNDSVWKRGQELGLLLTVCGLMHFRSAIELFFSNGRAYTYWTTQTKIMNSYKYPSSDCIPLFHHQYSLQHHFLDMDIFDSKRCGRYIYMYVISQSGCSPGECGGVLTCSLAPRQQDCDLNSCTPCKLYTRKNDTFTR